MQVQQISNQQYQQNFKAKFIRNNALRNLKTSISHSENAVLEKQIKLIKKVNDNKVFGYETYPEDSFGNSSRIFELIKHNRKEYKCTKVAAPKNDYQFLFNTLHQEYRSKFLGNINLD